MKTLNMLVIGLIATGLVHAGDREGGNGPNTSGISAPVRLDRSFTPKELVDSMYKCSTKLSKSIYEQMFRRSAGELRPYRPSEWSKTEPLVYARVWESSVARNEVTEDGQRKYQVVNFFGSWINPKGSTFMLSISTGGDRDLTSYGQHYATDGALGVTVNFREGDVPGMKERRAYVLPKGISLYAYERTLSNIEFNDYGDVASCQENTTNLHILMPTTDGRAVPLYKKYDLNGLDQLGPQTKIVVDTVGFRDCLQAELQH